jgi:disulfide bond formation protein DsbB
MQALLSPRGVFFLLFLGCAGAMAFAVLFLQQALGLAPCPLCVTQRVFVILTGLFALLGAVHNPARTGRRIYAGLCALSAVGGGAVAARHVWLQHLPEDQVPACGPGLDYILDTLPLRDAFSVIMMGDGNCAEELWSFLGLSIPEQTLILFAGLAVLSGWQLLRR